MIIQDVVEQARSLGIQQGATVYVASNVARFGIPPELRALVKADGPDALMRGHLETLREIVGSTGTLLMPTFTYSACRDELYNPRQTPSSVGSLTDYFWRQDGVERSMHPIFSVAASGPAGGELLDIGNLDCFGVESLFDRLRTMDATYLMYGVNMWEGSTNVYHAEQRAGVRYRYIKEFEGKVMGLDGAVHEAPVPYFVRNYDIPYKDAWRELQADSIADGVTRFAGSERLPLLAHEGRQIDEYICAKLSGDPDYLIELM